MKRIIFALTLSCSLIAFSSFDGKININEAVKHSFETSFRNATEVSWTTINNTYKVSFVYNDQHVSAFYNESGQMIAVTKNMTSNQLPFNLQLSLKNSYDQYWITELFELTNEEGTYYYATIENGHSRLILKSNTETGWMTYRKSSKQ